MRSRNARWILALAFPVALAVAAGTEPPADISYQGQFLDADGNPLEGLVNLQIRIYESLAPSPGELALFVEDHSGTALSKGVFRITIGGGSTVSGALGPETFEGTNRYLEVYVNGERLSPRQSFNSVPYAFRASHAETTSGALHVFDADDVEIGPLVSTEHGWVYVYLATVEATGKIFKFNGLFQYAMVYFTQEGCAGQSFVQLGHAGFVVSDACCDDPNQRLFVGENVLGAETELRSYLLRGECFASTSSFDAVPAIEVTRSELGIPETLAAPLRIGPSP